MTIAPGTLFGPYEIVSLIGAGGMGEVYRGRDSRLGRPVAIKILSPAAFGDSGAIRRFEDEARAAASVSHPNLIAIHDVGHSGEVHYLVMDLLEGETLRARLAAGALPWRKAAELAMAIADGIGAVHARGIVHRDLKPENIFITAEGWVKLLDFGLAIARLPVAHVDDDAATAARTEDGIVLGTPAYMSPEQLRNQELDARSDIFAVGCVLLEMLTGRAAFRRATPADTMAAVLTEDVEVPASIPAEMRQIARRCLDRRRENRFQTAADLAFALRLLLEGRAPATAVPDEGDASIAVLPFVNLSGNPAEDYFSEGLSEEILTALARVPGLNVTARTSAFAFRGKVQDIRRIGEALGVRTILEGSVRHAGNRVRVNAQLVDTVSGYHLWSAKYDRAMNDVFAVQDEIASAIVETLQLQLVPAKRSAMRQTTNIDAYHAFLKSRHHFSMLSPEFLAISRTYAEEAIAHDPRYAAAQAQLAECFIQSAIYGLAPALEVMPRARAAALEAVRLDPTEAAAHMTLARIAGEFDLDWAEALHRCRLALACERITPAVRALCALFVLWPLGRLDDITAAITPAVAADPLSPMPRVILAHVMVARGEYDRAVKEIGSVVAMHRHFWPGWLGLGFIHTMLGRTSEAIAALEKCVETGRWNAPPAGLLAGNYLRAGDPARAEQTMARLDLAPPHFAAMARGCLHFVAGDFARVAAEMEIALAARYPVLADYLTWLCLLDELRESAPMRVLRAQMNLDAH